MSIPPGAAGWHTTGAAILRAAGPLDISIIQPAKGANLICALLSNCPCTLGRKDVSTVWQQPQ